MWDGIAKKTLGSEFFMNKLIEANPAHQSIVIFPANLTIVIPDLPTASTQSLPPWKRTDSR